MINALEHSAKLVNLMGLKFVNCKRRKKFARRWRLIERICFVQYESRMSTVDT